MAFDLDAKVALVNESIGGCAKFINRALQRAPLHRLEAFVTGCLNEPVEHRHEGLSKHLVLVSMQGDEPTLQAANFVHT